MNIVSRRARWTIGLGSLGLLCLALTLTSKPASAQSTSKWTGGVGGTWIEGGSGWNSGGTWSSATSTIANFTIATPTNITVSGGPAPVRAYIEELLPDILEGRIEPGRVFDRVVGLDEVPAGYQAMADRESIKVMVAP